MHSSITWPVALGIEVETPLRYSDSTLYRHQTSILSYLDVKPWDAAARELTESTMRMIAEAWTDPADLINAALDALIRHRFELPSMATLRRMAGAVHSGVNAAQWQRVFAQLNESLCAALEALLETDTKTQESPFAELCRAPGRASRKNLKTLIDRYHSLLGLPDPTNALRSVAVSKVLQWANEARRLKAPELREYVTPRVTAGAKTVLIGRSENRDASAWVFGMVGRGTAGYHPWRCTRRAASVQGCPSRSRALSIVAQACSSRS